MANKTSNNGKVLVRRFGHVAVFYKQVRETEKSIWLQEIGSDTKPSKDNTMYKWEVVPVVNDTRGEVFRKSKTSNGLFRMDNYSFVSEYDDSKPVFETIF